MASFSCLFVALLAASKLLVANADNFPASRNPFEGVLATESIPQFITLTFSGGLSVPRVDAIRKYVMNATDANGCSPKFTAFVSFDYTDCDLVNGIYKGGHELASHTLEHSVFPTLEQIQEGINYFDQQCGIPSGEIKGFRTPYLSYDQNTLDSLHSLGVMYDSSIVADDGEASDYGRNNYWPFTWDSPADADITCNCNKSKPLPGMWEIPMYRMYPGETIADPSVSALQENFERRYNGNRAPLGVYIESSIESNEAAGQALAAWIANIQNNYNDAFFVTNQELIGWMKSPSAGYQPSSCGGQVLDCFPPGPTYTCPYGSSWNLDSCACECTPGFCMNEQGTCTQAACDGTEAAEPCCSGNFRNCINFCGSTLDECRACTANTDDVYGWLTDGDLGTSCAARYESCHSDEDSCCPGLSCVRTDEFTASCEYLESEEPSFSRQPSSAPTSSTPPSLQPSIAPSGIPSVVPSAQPSSEPSVSHMPSPGPSEQPSLQPTGSRPPSSAPSQGPSLAPSAPPSTVPSATPTMPPSDMPSTVPSDQPSSVPSAPPTLPPTGAPSATPSASPTSSESPTMLPSDVPSQVPTTSPTDMFSDAPTLSGAPSISPSDVPSTVPTSSPSDSPTATASESPTSTPSAYPSDVPSMVPTSSPSDSPTATASDSPTSTPSAYPSDAPSMIPSSQPSDSPTTTASESPTSTPTTSPSDVPSMIPSSPPSGVFSVAPTVSLQPSPMPSDAPTTIPSSAPSSMPSEAPSNVLSVTPTASFQPTSYPTVSPSDIPSTVPTVGPSAAPTDILSSAPTEPIVPCCSQDHKNCISWCGDDRAGCDQCNLWGGYIWLPRGDADETCIEREGVGCTYGQPDDGCCLGLVCTNQTTFFKCQVDVNYSEEEASEAPSVLPSQAPSMMLSASPSTAPTAPTAAPSAQPSSTPSEFVCQSDTDCADMSEGILVGVCSEGVCVQAAKPCLDNSFCTAANVDPYQGICEDSVCVERFNCQNGSYNATLDACLCVGGPAPSVGPGYCHNELGQCTVPRVVNGELLFECPEGSGTGHLEAPSSAPSTAPSAVPTIASSSSPTDVESSSPSLSPSSKPSKAPTTSPTSSPSDVPSTVPTNAPVDSPSLAPSNAPIGVPSKSPSAVPIEEPSSAPVEAPTMAPSAVPSTGPTGSPVASPSSAPSNNPIGVPSKSPSTAPSEKPSSAPVGTPSLAPSEAPSSGPTGSPVVSPSSAPSSAPIGVPSKSPSAVPSEKPTNAPVGTPSLSPSEAPSKGPTGSPVAAPTSSPTSAPTTSPSTSPSSAPSEGPTDIASASPTSSSIPSAAPTNAPTSSPTIFTCNNDSQCSDLDEGILVGVCRDGDCVQEPKPCTDNSFCTAANIDPNKGVCVDNVCQSVFNCFSGEYSEEEETCLCTGGPTPSAGPGYCQDVAGQCRMLRVYEGTGFVCPEDSLGSGWPVVPTTSPTFAPTTSPTIAPTADPTVSPTIQPTTTAAVPEPTKAPASGGGGGEPADGCCSMDFKTCIGWCGTDEAGCAACNQWGGYVWLPTGARSGCSGSWESCAADSDCCNAALSCKWGQCAP